MGRTFDDLAQARELHRAEGEFLETHDAVGGLLQYAEEIGANRQQRDEHRAVVARGAEEAQERFPVFLRRDREQLLELVDGNQDVGLARAGLRLQRFGEIGERGGASVGDKPLAPAAPVTGLADRLAGSAGEFADRVEARTERRQDDPVALVATQARQNAGSHQRRLARTGRAEEGDDVRRALHAAGAQPFDQPADVVVAAEEDGGVFGLEGEQTGIGRAVAVPGKAALGIEGELDQLGAEPFKAALAVLDEIELLDVRRDEAFAPRRDDDRKDRLAERPRLGEFGEAPFAFQPVRR